MNRIPLVPKKKNKPGTWHLRLYIAGETPRSIVALTKLKKISEEYLKNRYTIEVVDLLKTPRLTRGNQILPIPTLVRKLPPPIKKIINDLKTERVLVGLDLNEGTPDVSDSESIRHYRHVSEVPLLVLVLDEKNKIRGLKWRTDDNVTRPLKQSQLPLAINTLLQRPINRKHDQPVVWGTLNFNPGTFQLFEGDREIIITKTEGLIIEHLMRNAGNVVTHSTLAEAVWGVAYPDASHILKVYIHRLREKLETDPSQPQIIMTKSGIGYFMTKPTGANKPVENNS